MLASDEKYVKTLKQLILQVEGLQETVHLRGNECACDDISHRKLCAYHAGLYNCLADIIGTVKNAVGYLEMGPE